MDGQHIFHFSEWRDETSLDRFVVEDRLFNTAQLEQRLAVTSLSKNIYYPYASHKVTGKLIQHTGLVVFVKQYFLQQGGAKQWIDQIGDALRKEGVPEGLIQNNYYINQEGTALLNYVLWENETSYDAFLQSSFPEMKKDEEGIQNAKGWLPEKAVVRRHRNFLNILMKRN